MHAGAIPLNRHHLALYLTGEHPCSYLDGRQARTLFVDPHAQLDGATYESLLEQGFRRSGTHVYRPACRGCAACIPARIPVEAFVPNRSQRRNWRHNAADIRLTAATPSFQPEHFALYQRYLATRHPGGIMSTDATEEAYRRFLVESWGGATRFLEMRLGTRLLAVAITDVLARGLSAVYTFFEPAMSRRALGTFAVLAQIETARHQQRPYLYLGYWLHDSPKMRYKEHFRPLEILDGRQWRRVERGESISLGEPSRT
ncbi:arginyltransferase [Thiocapsa imhoffii]|uniref:Aspartate/glutamate leucyltransferase n=1 Tax=Thiocapsa imhoffii TaxID=382777 RepID=A0A9X0WEY1_9GAMM|nr:arginyltransferase [Thiocapsa imhoffii]MBK1643305.1 arginyltransferase [Thiocapsa imhoffii]